MSVDFSNAGRDARERICAPEAPLDGIRRRAAGAAQRQRKALTGVLAAMALVCVTVGTGAAERAYNGIRIWISGSRSAMEVRSLAIIKDPMPSEFRAVVRSAAFRPIFPQGIAPGAHIMRIMYTPADHPNAINVQYAPQRGRPFSVTLVQSSSIDTRMLPPGLSGVPTDVLRVGDEAVITPKAYPLPSFLKWSASSAQSEAFTEAFGARIRVMEPHPNIVAAAERIAAGEANATVIGRQYASTIPKLARARKPLLDTRTVFLTAIRTVNGKPDYEHATLQWPVQVAVDVAGVRALDDALRTHPCTCPMLIVPTASAYRVWLLDPDGRVVWHP